MASIIIEEIMPTKWRLRLRDADGKTRELDYRTGTPLDLGAKPATKEKAAVTAKTSTTAKDKAKPTKPKEQAKEQRPMSKARASETSEAPREEAAAQTATVKPAPEPPALRRQKPDAGTGPGALVWEAIEDDGVPGIRAPFARGAFKILHAGGDAYGLFYEWNSGKYQTLSCGTLESLKQTAATWTADGELKPPRSNLGAEAAKVACAPKENPPAAPTVPPPAPPIDPEKDKVLMEGFEATVQKLLAAKKGSP